MFANLYTVPLSLNSSSTKYNPTIENDFIYVKKVKNNWQYFLVIFFEFAQIRKSKQKPLLVCNQNSLEETVLILSCKNVLEPLPLFCSYFPDGFYLFLWCDQLLLILSHLYTNAGEHSTLVPFVPGTMLFQNLQRNTFTNHSSGYKNSSTTEIIKKNHSQTFSNPSGHTKISK